MFASIYTRSVEIHKTSLTLTEKLSLKGAKYNIESYKLNHIHEPVKVFGKNIISIIRDTICCGDIVNINVIVFVK